MSNSSEISGATASLESNVHIKELYSLLRENGKETTGLDALISTVKGMEGLIKSAETRMEVLQANLNIMKEIQAHPIKHMLQKANNNMKIQIEGMKTCISRVKNNIINGCKKAVISCKEVGIKALDKLASFFRIKPMLQMISKKAQSCMNQCDKNIARMETFSTEYHETGLHLKNMVRMLVGRDPVDKPKEIGKLANTVCNSYRREKSFFSSIRNIVNNVIRKVEQLENSVDAIREKKEIEKLSKPLMTKLTENKDKVRQLDLAKPVPGIAKSEVTP